MMAVKPLFSVSVRDLVLFACRTGDLGGDGNFSGPNRALEGTRGHQRVQKSRPPGYETEVMVSAQFETEQFTLTLKGRIDGILTQENGVTLEEIKTVTGLTLPEADPLHWAQAKIYGHLYAEQHGLSHLELHLSYLLLETEQVTTYRQSVTALELAGFFNQALAIYLDWLRLQVDWVVLRDKSIGQLSFPFAYRPGQRPLAVAAYRAVSRGGKLFAEAPTGIGKTISVLFPTIKALAEGHVEKIFYLTAKTIGRTVAQKALADLRKGGVRFRSLTLTAREKICFNTGLPCDVRACPFALGYYDRNRKALRAALDHEVITRETLESVARQFIVCPFALSLDLVPWVDGVICDYNYVFDPSAFLKGFFTEEKGNYAFLVDEAHNLVDRAREMFSAELEKSALWEVQKTIKVQLPYCAKALREINRLLLALGEQGEQGGQSVLETVPEELVKKIRVFLQEAETWLSLNEPAPFRQVLLDCYFQLNTFVKTAELFDHRFVTLVQSRSHWVRVRLYCLDPSHLIRQALNRGRAAVFFSATLSPLPYFHEILGGSESDPMLQLPSPFAPDHLGLLVAGWIATDYKSRNSTFHQVAQAIASVVAGRRGNYLVFFPSYVYLNALAELFSRASPGSTLFVQTPGMSEGERELFLEAFHLEHAETRVGFAVMGGIFGEGIDLVGDRLVGAIVVGVGLPQVCQERDLIRNYFQNKNGYGFDYAYTFPGMNRVLQAVGRVIRSETDRGVALLIDVRFNRPGYRRLLPPWWQVQPVPHLEALTQAVDQFWQGPCAVEDQRPDSSGLPAE